MHAVKADVPFHRIVLLLVGVGLLVRVLAVLALGDYRNPIAAEYGIVARNLVAGKGFVGGGWLGPEAPTALNVPLYPLFLAAWLKVGGDLGYLGVELSQAVLSALMVYLVAAIALRLSGWLTGLIAGGVVAFYPPLIYFCKQISPAIFTAFFAAVSLYLVLELFDKPTWTRAVGLGLVAGVALHVEPILLLALPGSALVGAASRSHAVERTPWRELLLAAAMCGITLLPWAVRNYAVFGQWVLFKTSFGLNVWLGNNPYATGIQYTAEGQPMQDTLSPAMRNHLASLNEAQRYSELAQQAVQWIRDHPRRFLELTVKRVWYMWWISPTYRLTTENIVEPRWFYVARSWIQVPVLALGLVGGARAWLRNRVLLAHCLWWIVVFTLPYAVSVAGNTRFRLPAEPMLLVLIAFGLAGIVQRLPALRSRVQPLEVAG
jgi:4-amino-4-deoxy-L-arabinose transferase-like glycosyltransferase